MEETKRTYKSHTFFVAYFSPEHPNFLIFEDSRKYWRKWLGSTRAYTDSTGKLRKGIRKGFVQLVIGDKQGAPNIDTSRE